METKEWKTIDKSGWERGPWDDEPDKIQWQDPDTGLPCLAVRNKYGSWCGYVGLTEDHPDFGKDYDEIDAHVHGGLTFADYCEGDICHVPDPGEPDHVYWLGFDCHHLWDMAQGMHALLNKIITDRPSSPFFPEVYRTLEYVKAECTSLAKQLQKRTL